MKFTLGENKDLLVGTCGDSLTELGSLGVAEFKLVLLLDISMNALSTCCMNKERGNNILLDLRTGYTGPSLLLMISNALLEYYRGS